MMVAAEREIYQRLKVPYYLLDFLHGGVNYGEAYSGPLDSLDRRTRLGKRTLGIWRPGPNLQPLHLDIRITDLNHYSQSTLMCKC